MTTTPSTQIELPLNLQIVRHFVHGAVYNKVYVATAPGNEVNHQRIHELSNHVFTDVYLVVIGRSTIAGLPNPDNNDIVEQALQLHWKLQAHDAIAPLGKWFNTPMTTVVETYVSQALDGYKLASEFYETLMTERRKKLVSTGSGWEA